MQCSEAGATMAANEKGIPIVCANGLAGDRRLLRRGAEFNPELHDQGTHPVDLGHRRRISARCVYILRPQLDTYTSPGHNRKGTAGELRTCEHRAAAPCH